MLTLRQILISAWIILLLMVALRRLDGTPQVAPAAQPVNQVQVMQVFDRP